MTRDVPGAQPRVGLIHRLTLVRFAPSDILQRKTNLQPCRCANVVAAAVQFMGSVAGDTHGLATVFP